MQGIRPALPCALIAALLVLAAPAGARAATGMELAVQDDAVLVSNSYYGRERGLDRAVDLNATWIRVNVLWSEVVGSSKNRRSRPSPVRYDFTSYDSLVSAARARGLKVQMALTGPAPAWAAGNKRRGVYKPKHRYYEDFVEATAAHFRDLVVRYSIWNEPNHVGWLTPLSSAPGIYSQLYRAGYSAIKRVDPGAQVLFGETAPYSSAKGRATPPLAFLRAVLRANRSYRGSSKYALLADGFAHHPYDFTHAPTHRFRGSDNVTLATLSRLTSALDKLARSRLLRTPQGGRLDVWLTEYGYMQSGRNKLRDTTRATYLKRGFDMARKHPRVRQMLQFLLVQPGREYRFFDTALLGRNGAETRTYRTLKSWAHSHAKAGRIARRGG